VVRTVPVIEELSVLESSVKEVSGLVTTKVAVNAGLATTAVVGIVAVVEEPSPLPPNSVTVEVVIARIFEVETAAAVVVISGVVKATAVTSGLLTSIVVRTIEVTKVL